MSTLTDGLSKYPSGSSREQIATTIFYCYLAGIIIWLSIIYALELYRNADFFTWILLLLPIIVLGIGAYNSRRVENDLDRTGNVTTILSVGFVITIPLLVWAGNNAKDRSKFVKIIIFAMILALLTLIDIWVTPEWAVAIKHCKSILLTMFVILVIFGFYGYFLEKTNGYFTNGTSNTL